MLIDQTELEIRRAFNEQKPAPLVSFSVTHKDDDWVMQIAGGDDGPTVEFNTERYPDLAADGFAKTVMDLLIKHFPEHCLRYNSH